MILLSCRKNGTSKRSFTDRFLFEHFMFGLNSLFEKGTVLINVHGYAADVTKTTEAYQEIADRCESTDIHYDNEIGFLWPGGIKFPLSYLLAKQRAKKAADFLTEILIDFLNSDIKVDINAHSLGAKVALEALTCLSESFGILPKNKKIRTLCLMAPAIDNEDLADKYKNAVSQTENTLVFYSKNDPVLGYLFPLNDFDTALGYSGLTGNEASNVVGFDCSNFIKRHNQYRKEDRVYQLWKEFGTLDSSKLIA